MMKTIAISFSLKDQSFESISEKLQMIADLHPNSLVVHGFLPRAEVEKRELPTDVVDALDILFPLQLNLNRDGQPLRAEMAYVMNKLEGRVYVIGEIVDGVKEQLDEYAKYNLEVVHHLL